MSDQATESVEGGDVHSVRVGPREFLLVGTAHISQQSVDIVREVIERERPDAVCVELDAARHAALSQGKRFEAQDLREILRNKQLATLMLNLILSSYQKRLGMQLGVMPGSELMEATKVAHELGLPVVLCDRDIRVTLRRSWHALSFWRKMILASSLLGSAFESPEISEEELARIRQKDVVSELMNELGEAMPDLKRVLIDERDAYLAEKIRRTAGDRIVAVVGAGHVAGMIDALESQVEIDLEALEEIPRVSKMWKWVGWAIPAIIIGSIFVIGRRQGVDAAGANALYWFLANSIPAGIGAVLALAHPATIAAAFFGAPFTSLTPVIGAGYVAAFAQLWFVPPRVREFQEVGDEMATVAGWWRNRLLRIFLVFMLSTVGSLIGTWVGGVAIVKNLIESGG